MKKTLLLIFALFMGTNMAFAQKSVAEKAAGTYSGLLYIGMGSPVTDETESSEANIRLEKETDTTVKFVLPNFKYGSMSLGDIVLTNIPVYEKADGTIAFGENNPQTLSLVGGMVSANVNIDHSNSTINGAYASVDVYVTTRILFSDVSIYVRFQGNNGDYEPEGIAHEMAGTRTGTAYSQYDGAVTSTSPTSSASAVITATNAQTIGLTLTGVEAQGVEIGDIVFGAVTVTDKGDGTATIGDATATGSIMGAMDYTMTLNGAKSYWSTDSMALDITADIAGMAFHIIFTTGVLPAEEEGPVVTTGPAAELAGTYTAAIYVAMGEPVSAETPKFIDAPIVIEAQSETTVRFTLKDFSLDGVNSLGDIVLNNIPVEKQADGTFKFGTNAPQAVSLAGGAIQANVNIDETTSYVDGEDLYIDVPVEAVGQYIYVHIGLPVMTGIAQVTTLAPNATVYDLQGRRVNSPRTSGVYVIGGKRVYLK